MVVGTLELALRLEGCRSLKDKRAILRSLIDRARREFHVAIAETGDLQLWGNATIGVACVSNDPGHAESILQHVVDVFDANPSISVESVVKDIDRR